jgi:hypothetical protein
MPKIFNPTSDDTCFYCGNRAYWVSVNSKIARCTEKITQCLGFIAKAEATRKKNSTPEKRREHMKKMSESGNKKLKELHTDPIWAQAKGERISNKIKERGGHYGKNNPMYNKFHTESAKKLQKEKANRRNPESYKQASNTKIKLGLAIPKEFKTTWELYQQQVDNYTYLSWKHYHDVINPNNLVRGDLYELDHKFSKTEGFRQGIPPEIIGHFANLELITKTENRSKRTKCSITKEQLYESVKVSVAPFSPSSDTDI